MGSISESGSFHSHQKETVLLVGSGITNLITADILVTHGYHVRLVDSGPDPRFCSDWTRLGTTCAGGNARMFTFTEADNYNAKGDESSSNNSASILRTTTLNRGWAVKSPEDFTPDELAWVDEFEQLPGCMARRFQDDMYEVNRHAGQLWAEYMKTAPQLFQDVTLKKDILRLYAESDALDKAADMNHRLGSLIRKMTALELIKEYPEFSTAFESNVLAGGIIVQGFTLDIHRFVARLMDRITSENGEFIWNCHIERMQLDSKGTVLCLDSNTERFKADHYVLCPGVKGNELLKGTASANRVQGVVGVWLQLPNLNPQMNHSVKIHRQGHLVEDINITLARDAKSGEDILMLGGGYGFIGLGHDPASLHDSPEMAALFNELEQVARMYFPRAYETARKRGMLWPNGDMKFCVRPFTSTGLGLFEKIHTVDGGLLIVTGGNNTGGFAQAPAVARGVWRALICEQDPIHALFHPDRGKARCS